MLYIVLLLKQGEWHCDGHAAVHRAAVASYEALGPQKCSAMLRKFTDLNKGFQFQINIYTFYIYI